MPTYEESNHVIRTAKDNLKHVVKHVSKSSQILVSNETSGDNPERKAYVRSMELTYEGNEGNVPSLAGVSISQDTKEHDVPSIENLYPDTDVALAQMHNRSSDPKVQLTPKSVNHSHIQSKYTVPQPFTLETDKRATGACKFASSNISNIDKKQSNMNNKESSNLIKKTQANSHLELRKPLHPENTKHMEEEDACSAVSLTTASIKAFKNCTTVALAPNFRVSKRAEKRKEFYSKLEQKQQALEAERIEYETRKKEEEETALKELRKSLNFRATPMPNFYHEGPPPKAELKKEAGTAFGSGHWMTAYFDPKLKIRVTRARSPRFGRRKSCEDVYNPLPLDGNNKTPGRPNRRSFDGTKDANKLRSSFKNGTALHKAKEESEQEVVNLVEVSYPNTQNKA